ncbi:MAG: hypothetical protein EZS28_000857 [Streblomastix strix]|uniref:Uncharacterized protein n=1 Tax=Streblomastix strix TaxID=222440 RepID=A0A5J4XA17_9EUKA|nr:MAG: hypothetical protein EZS28_000857 [Streblomastix strix]
MALLWSELQKHINKPESNEIKRTLGIAVIDENQRLFNEIEGLSALGTAYEEKEAKNEENSKVPEQLVVRSRQKDQLEKSIAVSVKELLELHRHNSPEDKRNDEEIMNELLTPPNFNKNDQLTYQVQGHLQLHHCHLLIQEIR